MGTDVGIYMAVIINYNAVIMLVNIWFQINYYKNNYIKHLIYSRLNVKLIRADYENILEKKQFCIKIKMVNIFHACG